MAVAESIRCVACGFDHKPQRFGISREGQFSSAMAPQNELSLRRTTIGGRGRCAVERYPLPLPFALGLRDMLKYRLAQVEAELRAAGVTLDDD